MTYLFTRSIILVFRQSFAVLATNTCLVAEWIRYNADNSSKVCRKTKGYWKSRKSQLKIAFVVHIHWRFWWSWNADIHFVFPRYDTFLLRANFIHLYWTTICRFFTVGGRVWFLFTSCIRQTNERSEWVCFTQVNNNLFVSGAIERSGHTWRFFRRSRQCDTSAISWAYFSPPLPC